MLPYIRLASSRSALYHFHNGSSILLNSYLPRNEFHYSVKNFSVLPQTNNNGLITLSQQTILLNSNILQLNSTRLYSQEAKKLSDVVDKSKQDTSILVEDKTKLSAKDKLKKAVKEYGSTVIIFHVCISLISLGCCYLLVSNELDVKPILEYFGWTDNKFISNTAATGTSTFVVAYALHKIFAPARISITIGCTPFIVRYLRTRGILKK